MNLFGLESVGDIDRKDIARRQLNNLLTSYADEADVFNEIIQNAYDSVIKAIQQDLYLAGKSIPRITVVIGRRTEGHHYFLVTDNGVGMSPTVAANLTVPGFSSGKKKGKTVGYKGVGASYFFAASQKIALRTVDANGIITEYTVRNSYDWIKNDEEEPPISEVKCEVPEAAKPFMVNRRGTTLCFYFHDGLTPKNLSGLVNYGDGPEKELKNWACFLASKTALGGVEDPAPKIEVELVLDLGDDVLRQQIWKLGAFDRENNVLGYPFPQLVFRQSKDVNEIENTPVEQKYKHIKKYQAVHRRWTAAEIIHETQMDAAEAEKLNDSLLWVEGYLCYSTDVLKEVNKRLGGRAYLIRYGMRIAVDGIPQGRNIDLALTSNQGLDRQCHIVLAFKGLELDTGRKISADEIIASAIVKLGQRVVMILKEYRVYMKKKDRPAFASDLTAWRDDVNSRAQTSMVEQLYKAYGLTPVLKVDPDSEAEVIALFVSLMRHDLLRGYKIAAISGYARYDSLCDCDTNSDALRDLEDTLSIREDSEELHGAERVLEFKDNFNSLLEEFDSKKKIPTEIDFVVCWVVPDINIARGRLEPCYGIWRDRRTLYAASYLWYDENETACIPVLALKNIVSELLARKEDVPGIGTGTFNAISAHDKEAEI